MSNEMMISFWEGRDLDKPHTVNGFRGTWKFSDHSLIPDTLNNFLHEAFHPVERLKRVPIEDINKLMNEVWEGPGSMVKLEKLTAEMRMARAERVASAKVVLDEVRTIDDYDDDEFQVKFTSSDDEAEAESNTDEDEIDVEEDDI